MSVKSQKPSPNHEQNFSLNSAQNSGRNSEMTIDYTKCEKEPITTPGAIQSYGGLVVVQRGEVIAYSKNIHEFLPIDSTHFLHRKVSEVAPELAEILKTLSAHPAGQTSFHILGQWLVGFRKAENESYNVEFFPHATHLFDMNGLEEEIDLLGRKFHYPVKDRSQFLNEICHLFQKFLRFDQVFVQVLQEGEVMEIVAEANNGKIEPVLGLHFSSKEIPSQARDLYLKQRIRFKQASQSTPADIVSDTDVRVDLSHSLLREPSKFMTVYMQNILASTLLSTSIVGDKKLTALLTMHNVAPLLVDPRTFDRIVAVVHKVSLELFRIDDLIAKNADSKLWELLMQDFPLSRVGAIEQLIHSPSFGKSLAHTGAAVMQSGKTVAKSGECPEEEILAAIVQKASKMAGSTHFTSKLAEDFCLPPASLGEFAGVMSIKFEDITVLFFRKSFHLELKWRNATPESFEQGTNLPRFSPAGSFHFLIQEFKNQSRPWSGKDIAFMNVIAKWISEELEF